MMVRKFLSSFIGAVAVASIGAAPAGASVPLPSGSISCSENAVITFNPPLTGAASTKPISVKVGQVTPVSCDTSGVTGGKAPITQFALKLPGFYKQSNCNNFGPDPAKPWKVQVKWQGLNPSNNVMTVAVSNTVATSVNFDTIGWTHLNYGTAPLIKAPFLGDTVAISMVPLISPAQIFTACGSPTGLASLPVSIQVTAAP